MVSSFHADNMYFMLKIKNKFRKTDGGCLQNMKQWDKLNNTCSHSAFKVKKSKYLMFLSYFKWIVMWQTKTEWILCYAKLTFECRDHRSDPNTTVWPSGTLVPDCCKFCLTLPESRTNPGILSMYPYLHVTRAPKCQRYLCGQLIMHV